MCTHWENRHSPVAAREQAKTSVGRRIQRNAEVLPRHDEEKGIIPENTVNTAVNPLPKDVANSLDYVQRHFATQTPNEVWVGDITMIRTQEGPLHQAVLLDLYSRRVVGWATSRHARYQVAEEALEMALLQRKPKPGLVHHSDRGPQYTAFAYQSYLQDEKIACSMSRPGTCLDNAVAESFFHTLKTEWVYHHRYATRQEAHASIFQYIEGFYNRTRKHSTLDYRSPDEYEREQSAA
jgi:putative transposase